jgi:hypothetical protein
MRAPRKRASRTLTANAKRRGAVLGVLMLVALIGSACRFGHSGSGGSMSLQVSSGIARVTGGASPVTVTGRGRIGLGDHVILGPGGLATLYLSPGVTFQMEAGEVLITASDRVQLVQGNVLAQLTRHGEIDAPGLSVASDAGVFRVDGGPSPRVGVYSGSATMRGTEASLHLTAYEQAVDTMGALPRSPSPLQILATDDVWDHQYLQSAIDLNNRLANFGSGLDAQLGNASGLAFFRIVLPSGTDVSYVVPYLDKSRSDVLIGWVIAADAAAKQHADPGQTFTAVMSLWEAGESWGLLAMQLGVSADEVFAGLLNAVREVGISVTSPVPKIPPLPVGTSEPPVEPTPVKPPLVQALPRVSPSPSPSPSPTPLLSGVVDPVTALLNEVTNLLLPSPSPSP